MPKRRLPLTLWNERRRLVWLRDGGRCRGPYCRHAPPLALNECHVDHVHSGKLAGNEIAGLRLLCRRCHALRLDKRHRGMIGPALRLGLIPPDWRRFAWDNEHWPDEATIKAMEQWITQS